jgi:hypothetical protein
METFPPFTIMLCAPTLPAIMVFALEVFASAIMDGLENFAINPMLLFNWLPFLSNKKPQNLCLAGTLPADWKLITGPSGMTVNVSTGEVSWSTVGSLEPITVTLRANNGFSTATVSFTLRVVPSYYCNATTTHTIEPVAATIRITGYCTYFSGTRTGAVPYAIRIWSAKNGNSHQLSFLIHFSSSNDHWHYICQFSLHLLFQSQLF